jgi:hypothetical protein
MSAMNLDFYSLLKKTSPSKKVVINDIFMIK